MMYIDEDARFSDAVDDTFHGAVFVFQKVVGSFAASVVCLPAHSVT